MLKFFRIPFALTGTRAAVPDTDPGGDAVNYEEGWTPPYQLPKTDPLSRNIPRDQSNQLMYDITQELQLLQIHGTPDFITSALNGGTPYSYTLGARVRYDDGTNGPRVFVSRVNANTALPTVAANWSPVRDSPPVAAAGGTANALTATFSPSLGLIPDGTIFYLRHAAANTGAATLAVNGGAAKPIVKRANVPLVAGDIAGAASWGLYAYDSALDRYFLLNAMVSPPTSRTVFTSSGTYTKPAGLRAIYFEFQAPGAGGGASQAATSIGQTSLGAGGGAGGFVSGYILASDLLTNETVTLPAGGLGGTTSGTAGAAPGATSFGAHVTFTAPAGGLAGGAASVASIRSAEAGNPGSGSAAGTVQGALSIAGIRGLFGTRYTSGNATGSGGGKSFLGYGGEPSVEGSGGVNGFLGNGGAGGTTGATAANDAFRVGGNGGNGRLSITEIF